jgi:hypothetical protein
MNDVGCLSFIWGLKYKNGYNVFIVIISYPFLFNFYLVLHMFIDSNQVIACNNCF